MSSKPVSQNVYEELPPPSEETADVGQKKQQPAAAKNSSGGNPNDSIGITKLADGAYDEAESHTGFLEALNAWRSAGKPKEE